MKEIDNTSQKGLNEIWKDVKGYEGLYVVSNLGRVKRVRSGRIRTQKIAKNGYCQVNLSKNNQVKFYLVHRLVANAFIPNPNNLPQVNHKDENKTNNYIENLEWCTQSYNNLLGTGTERQNYSRHKNDPQGLSWERALKIRDKNNNVNSSKRVYQYDKKGNLIAIFKSISEASRKLGISAGHICNCCKGIRNIANGYKFYYKNNLETNDNIKDI